VQEKGGYMGKLTSILLAAILLATAAWWLLHEPSIAENEIRITYLDGKTCLVKDWSFLIKRRASMSNASDGMMRKCRSNSQWDTVKDTDLRIYSSTGEKLHIPREKLLEITFDSQSHPDIGNDKRTVNITISTTDNLFSIDAEELPDFSRKRLLVPVASHYFPDQDDDYMSWGNVIMTINGTVEDQSCPDRDVGLTRPDHPADRTPVRIEFTN
jgi:hypothetical protein